MTVSQQKRRSKSADIIYRASYMLELLDIEPEMRERLKEIAQQVYEGKIKPPAKEIDKCECGHLKTKHDAYGCSAKLPGRRSEAIYCSCPQGYAKPA